MMRKLIIAMSTVLLMGGVMFGIGSAMDSETNVHQDSSLAAASTGALPGKKQEMEQFSSVDLSVVGADIYLVEGDNYAVEYRFHNREVLERLEVSNDTLYLSTDYSGDWKPDHGNFSVVVTVPKGTSLNDVHLSTVAGNIIVENQVCTAGALSTTAGKLELSNVTADEIQAQTVSGTISVKESKIHNVSAENKTGAIQLDGEFAVANAYSVSSACELNGSLSESASIETISGEITVSVSNSAAVEASSYGKVYWNELRQGYSFAKADGDAKLTLKSVSGKIRVTEGTVKE